jgi:hypothetical protein
VWSANPDLRSRQLVSCLHSVQATQAAIETRQRAQEGGWCGIIHASDTHLVASGHPQQAKMTSITTRMRERRTRHSRDSAAALMTPQNNTPTVATTKPDSKPADSGHNDRTNSADAATCQSYTCAITHDRARHASAAGVAGASASGGDAGKLPLSQQRARVLVISPL